MATQTLEIQRSSASMWGTKTGIRTLPTVAKYIDTSTCIGCKACEAACQEWNDLKRVPTSQDGSYQTMPELDAEFWNLIRFKEMEVNGGLDWLMRKDQCMHCAEPGCLAACPAPGAIVQYANGIVDVNPEACIGCGYCATGCPFDVPKFHAKTGKMAKCTLCVDRVEVGLEPACIKACPTGCLSFGTKEDMVALGILRVKQLKESGFKDAVLYDPQGVGGTSVITVLKHDRPEWYNLPVDPHVSLGVRLWKSIVRPLGVFAGLATVLSLFGHYTKYGPKEVPGSDAPPDARNLPPPPPDYRDQGRVS
jgi:formate dehydrogenase iron-sulfur subunit